MPRKSKVLASPKSERKEEVASLTSALAKARLAKPEYDESRVLAQSSTQSMSRSKVYQFFQDRICNADFIDTLYQEEVIATCKMHKGKCQSAILFTTQYSDELDEDIAILHLAYTEPAFRGDGLMSDLFIDTITNGLLGDVGAILCQPVTKKADTFWAARGFTKVLEENWGEEEEKWTDDSDGALSTIQTDRSTFIDASFELFPYGEEYPVMIYTAGSV